MMKPTIICLMGPTAAGKTDLAIELVQHFPCDIISVDSAMVYQGMNIGTAKPSAEILKIAPHHLIDIRDPATPYSAGEFRRDALTEISNILTLGKIPLLVGGTMLYFKVLQEGLAELPPANADVRQFLLAEAEQHGWPALHKRLQKIDADTAARIQPTDPQRIQRALEIYEITGKTLTQLHTEHAEPIFPFNIINLALIPLDRDKLSKRITHRFEAMLQQGLVEEVEKLFQRQDLHPDLPSIRAVGYRQIWDYLAKTSTYAHMQEKGIIATRQLAKRQLTWLKSWKNLHIIVHEDTSVADIFSNLNSMAFRNLPKI